MAKKKSATDASCQGCPYCDPRCPFCGKPMPRDALRLKPWPYPWQWVPYYPWQWTPYPWTYQPSDTTGGVTWGHSTITNAEPGITFANLDLDNARTSGTDSAGRSTFSNVTG
jgi:hypothetical protein